MAEFNLLAGALQESRVGNTYLRQQSTMNSSLDVHLITDYEGHEYLSDKEGSIIEYLSEIYPLVSHVITLMIPPLRTLLISSCYEEDAA